jgi:hypothetical protein
MPLKRRSQDVHCPMKAVPSLPRFMSTNINLDIWVPLHHYPTNFQILPGQWCQIADISLISGVHSGSVPPSILRSTKFMALRSISFALSWLKEGSHDYNFESPSCFLASPSHSLSNHLPAQRLHTPGSQDFPEHSTERY